jgi:hypothetical protein
MAFPIVLSPGQTTQFGIKFLPSAIGARTGTFAVASNAPTPSVDVDLTGTGLEVLPGPEGSTVAYYVSLAAGTFADITVTPPNGSAGDLMIVVMSGDSSTVVTPPEGWTMVEQYIGDGTAEFLAMFWKVRGASEPSAVFDRASSSYTIWACHNFIVTGRPGMTEYDDHSMTTTLSPSPNYTATNIVTSKRNTLLIMATATAYLDTNLLSYDGPNGPDGLLPSPGILSSGPTTLGTFDYTMWAQTLGAYHSGYPYNVRVFVGFWSGEGNTAPVTIASPIGNTMGTTFLAAFREPD